MRLVSKSQRLPPDVLHFQDTGALIHDTRDKRVSTRRPVEARNVPICICEKEIMYSTNSVHIFLVLNIHK